ncbi:MAG: YifB family Mg chelatase-like AAA ATPase [Planctomycetota bacterium]|jgi:magnesium chelatase family protein
MLSRIQSFVLTGIDAISCEIEIDVANRSMPSTHIVGLPDAAVKEALDRVRAAIQNTGYSFPQGRVLINLAPADVRKEGPVYDLPIAVGVLIAEGVIEAGDRGAIDPRACVFAGELALDGRVRPIKGAISMALLARQMGARSVVVPAENATEASVVGGLDVYGVRTLAELVGLFNGQISAEPMAPIDVAGLVEATAASIDFAEVKGQEGVKRAITIAASGSHNLLMIGPAGTGKSMMAKALPGILPALTPDEALEVTRIYSAAGLLNRSASSSGLMTSRPVRTPHHTASTSAVIGGGQVPRPGEVTLAHKGVLFLDELPEFTRDVLETLRQPLEDDVVTIARAHSTVAFPASLMLIAALNPTPKGATPTSIAGQREMERYLSRLSGPLVDRIDIHVEAPAVPWKQLRDTNSRGTSSEQMRERVLLARETQIARQGHVANARLRTKDLDQIASLDDAGEALLGQAISELGLSARAYDKVRRVARTIADVDGKTAIGAPHIAEAVQYRLLDRPSWFGGTPQMAGSR